MKRFFNARFQAALSYVALSLLFALAFGAGSVLADGKVTIVAPVISSWGIEDVRFARLKTEQTAVIAVGYRRTDGTLDHVNEVSMSGPSYTRLLIAISMSAGPEEATITTTLTNPDGTTQQVPDLAAIFTYRISKFLVSGGYIKGVTAEATVAPTSTQ